MVQRRRNGKEGKGVMEVEVLGKSIFHQRLDHIGISK